MFTFTSLLASAGLLSAVLAVPLEDRQASKFSFYDLTTPLASPCDLTTGPDGMIYADTFTSNKIVRVDPYSGALEEFDIPYRLPILNDSVLPQVQGIVALSCVVQPGKDGKVYAAAGIRNEFIRFDPETHDIEIFDTGNPLGNLEPFNDAWPGETGMFFSQTTGNVISLFDYKTTKIQNFEVPTPLAGPLGMIVASDGALWFTEILANKIGRLNATDGTFKEYDLPLSLFSPSVMRAETEGRYLWFTALLTNAIGRIDIYTGETKTYTDPRLLALPIEDTVDGEGNIWYSTLTRNSLNYLTPSTGKLTTIEQPDGGLEILPDLLPNILPTADIAIHYNKGDNSIWFTELLGNRIGKYCLS